MKKLEHFMNSSPDQKDFMEPDEGHFIRFQQKLKYSILPSKRMYIWISAALFIGFIMAANILLINSRKTNVLSFELKETAYYYDQKSENLLLQIQQNANMDHIQKRNIMDDLQSFEKEYDSILKDLKEFPGDERIINAFIDYHKSKAEFLEEILNQLDVNNLITI